MSSTFTVTVTLDMSQDVIIEIFAPSEVGLAVVERVNIDTGNVTGEPLMADIRRAITDRYFVGPCLGDKLLFETDVIGFWHGVFEIDFASRKFLDRGHAVACLAIASDSAAAGDKLAMFRFRQIKAHMEREGWEVPAVYR